MATIPVLSKSMSITWGGKVIARTTDFSLEINKEVVEITTLQSEGWKEKLVDLKDWKVSFNALVTRGADATFQVYDAILNDFLTSDNPVVIVLADGGAGATFTLTGSALLVVLSTGVAVGDKVTYSGTLEGTGGLV